MNNYKQAMKTFPTRFHSNHRIIEKNTNQTVDFINVISLF